MNEHMQYKYCRYNISRPPIISNIFFFLKKEHNTKSIKPTLADVPLLLTSPYSYKL